MAGLAQGGWAPSGTQHRVKVLSPMNLMGRYGGSHGHKDLIDAISAQSSKVDLIIAAGGLVAGESAWTALTSIPIPFIFLSGVEPPQGAAPNGKYCGVILNTFNQYSGVRDSLKDKNALYLIQNTNSDMQGTEASWWSTNIGTTPIKLFFGEDNDATQFASELGSAFTDLNPEAVIVSSDPFFTWKAKELTTALANLNVPVYYAFQQLVDATSNANAKLLPGGASLASANTSDPQNAYYQLGLRAADVLSAQTPANPVPTSSIKSAIWSNSKWILQ